MQAPEGDLLVCRNPRIIAEVKGGRRPRPHPTGHQAVAGRHRPGGGQRQRGPRVLIVRRFRRPVELWDAVMAATTGC